MVNHSSMLETPLDYGCNSSSIGLKQQEHSAEQVQLQYSPYALTSVTYKNV